MNAGFLSSQSIEPNAIERARLRRLGSGLPLIDLTDTNFTKNGFLFPAITLEDKIRDYLNARTYSPDPRGSLAARLAICNYYAERTPPLLLSPEEIFITSSTSEAYLLLFSLLANAGDNFLTPNISYPLFEMLAEAAKVRLCSYELRCEENWEVNYSALGDLVDAQSRGIIIVSPHNPTGMITQLATPELLALQLPVISDEVFERFVESGVTAPPLGAIYPELPVFHLNGISKMFALPDLKLGWIALNHSAFKLYGERLALLNDSLLGANQLTQALLPTIFTCGEEFSRQMSAEIRDRMQICYQLLAAIRGSKISLPPGGTHLLLQLPSLYDEEKTVLQLIERGVLVHPGYFYQSGLVNDTDLPPLLVISAVTQRERLIAGCKVIVDTLAENIS